VGNLESERDFTDVRDVARAYRLLVEQGQPGQAYNIASGKAVPIQAVLDLLCELAGVRPRVEIDPARYRPRDDPPMLSVEKIREHTGWRPEIPLRATLEDIYATVTSPHAPGQEKTPS
jgi:GDP-4-dehydro-6-deoxy-D-mannose reductase